MSRRIRRRGLKVYDGFFRPGVTQFFARQSFDGFRVVSEGVNFVLEFLGSLHLFLDFDIQPVNFAPVIFILLDERQVSHADEQQNGHGHQRDDHLR